MNDQRPLQQLFFVALGVVLLACAGVYVATTRWGSGESSAFDQHTGSGGEEEIVRAFEGEAQRRTADEARTQGALSKTRAVTLLEWVSKVKAIATQAKNAASKWETDAPALLGSDAGRRLASDPSRVKAFMLLQAKTSRPDADAMTQLLERLALLETELERIRSAELPTLSSEAHQQFEAQIAGAHNEATAALAALQTDLGALDSLVYASASDAPIAHSLAEAVAEMKREERDRQARETAEQLAKVNEEQHRLAMKEEAERLLDARERERKAREDAAREEVERKEKKHWEAKAASEQVKADFQPLLANGTKQPNRRMQWDETHKPAVPVSLAMLQWTGALDDFDKFLELMTRTDRYGNDRGAWMSPANNAELRKDYRQRFEDLQKLAPIWVESGLLGK